MVNTERYRSKQSDFEAALGATAFAEQLPSKQ
jgi:hypothetical protein